MVQRFCDTWREFDPGRSCSIAALTCNGDVDSSISKMFHDMPVDFHRYDGAGCDLGSAQKISHAFDQTFMVNMTSRCYFWKSDWLRRLVIAREAIGPDLFGCYASRESGHLHLCTRAYCLDSDDFKQYPVEIQSRNQGVFFECGDGCLLDWFEGRGRAAWVVGWSGIHEKADWFKISNRFRNGDQSDCLIFDKHTDIYRDAEGDFKTQLEEMANNGGNV